MFKLIKALEYTSVNGEGSEEVRPIMSNPESQTSRTHDSGAGIGMGNVANTARAQDVDLEKQVN
jgi:hypothetical protein